MKKIMCAVAVLATIAAGAVAAWIQQNRGEDYASVDDAIRDNLPEGYAVYERFSLGEDWLIVLRAPKLNSYGILLLYQYGENYRLHSLELSYENKTAITLTYQKKKAWKAKLILAPGENGELLCSMEEIKE